MVREDKENTNRESINMKNIIIQQTGDKEYITEKNKICLMMNEYNRKTSEL